MSKRARRLQPWCSDCGSVEDLTTDHSVAAWERKDAGKAIRLEDVDVVCRSCNSRRGRARPQGRGPLDEVKGPRAKPQSRLLTGPRLAAPSPDEQGVRALDHSAVGEVDSDQPLLAFVSGNVLEQFGTAEGRGRSRARVDDDDTAVTARRLQIDHPRSLA